MTLQHGPQAPIWEAVSTLEREFYTKQEIADHLRDVARSLESDELEVHVYE